MKGIGGADELVLLDVKMRPHIPELRRHPVHKLLGFEIHSQGRFRNFLPVLICSGKKIGFLPEKLSVPDKNIRNDGGVCVAYVGMAVDIINRGGDVKGFTHVNFRTYSGI